MGVRCAAAALLLLFFMLIRCSFEEPQTPSWDVDIKFPITSKSISMHDLIVDNKSVFDYADGLVGLRAEGDIDKVQVGERFLLNDVESFFQVDIPNITIARLTADIVDFSFSALTSQASNINTENKPVSAFTFADVRGYLLPEQDLVTIEVIEGIARLVYTNNLPVELRDVIFYLEEPGTHEIKLRSLRIPLIPAGKKDSLDLSINNKNLTRFGEWFVTGSSPGSMGRPILVNGNMKVNLNVDFVDFRVSNIQGRNQSFYIEDQQSVCVEREAAIQEAVFSAGSLELNIHNEIDMDLELDIKAKEILGTSSNQPLLINRKVTANGSRPASVSLTGYKLFMGTSPVKPVDLHFLIEAKGASPVDELVTISEEDVIKVNMGIHDAAFESFWGCLDHYVVPIDSTVQIVKLPAGLRDFSGLNLADGRLRIDFFSTVEMPIRIEGKLRGVSGQGKSTDVRLSADIMEGSANQPSVTSIVLRTPENSEILDLLNLPPKTIQFTGSALIGDGQKAGLLTSSSSLTAHYFLETPAIMTWNESVFTPDSINLLIHPLNAPSSITGKDVIHLNAKDTNQLRSFSITAEIENHLPLSADIEFQLIDASAPENERIINLTPIKVPSAPTDNWGRTIAAQKISSTVSFNNDGLAKFQNKGDVPRSLSLITLLRIHGTKDNRVKVFDTDFISINAAVEARVLVGSD